MGHNTPMEQPRITPTLYWTNHDQRSMVNVDYCSCIECQVTVLFDPALEMYNSL